jgi:excisionase family DNA binding protein
MEAKILTLDQVARHLQLSPRSVYELARRSEIPSFKLANQWRFDRELLDAFIRQQSQPPAAPGEAPEPDSRPPPPIPPAPRAA